MRGRIYCVSWLPNIAFCLALLFIAVIKVMIKSLMKMKGFVSAYRCSTSGREVGAGTQGRNLE